MVRGWQSVSLMQPGGWSQSKKAALLCPRDREPWHVECLGQNGPVAFLIH